MKKTQLDMFCTRETKMLVLVYPMEQKSTTRLQGFFFLCHNTMQGNLRALVSELTTKFYSVNELQFVAAELPKLNI